MVDLTDAGRLADHQAWAATTPAAADTAFNVVNGDVVRWRRSWPRLAEHGLVEPDVSRLASWWHTDSDLGRRIEVPAGTTRSRLAGSTGYVSTERSLLRLLDRCRAERLLP